MSIGPLSRIAHTFLSEVWAMSVMLGHAGRVPKEPVAVLAYHFYAEQAVPAAMRRLAKEGFLTPDPSQKDWLKVKNVKGIESETLVGEDPGDLAPGALRNIVQAWRGGVREFCLGHMEVPLGAFSDYAVEIRTEGYQNHKLKTLTFPSFDVVPSGRVQPGGPRPA